MAFENRLRAWSDGARMPVTGGVEVAVPGLLSQGDVSAVIVAPRKGIVKNLYARQETAPGAQTSAKYTLYVGGSVTALAATISGAAATEASDLTHKIQVAAGNKLEIVFTVVGNPASPGNVRVEVEIA